MNEKLQIFVDTNILISAFVFGGKTLKLLKLLSQNTEIELLVSAYIENEFAQKLLLKWFSKAKEAWNHYLSYEFKLLANSPIILTTQIRDDNDIQVLNDAIYHGVDILLTGDKDFAEVKITAEKPKIMTPSELAEMLEIEI